LEAEGVLMAYTAVRKEMLASVRFFELRKQGQRWAGVECDGQGILDIFGQDASALRMLGK
jgi:hypothetical protein